MPPHVLPTEAHEWWAVVDDEGARWMFDITFLDSAFGCIWGDGCPSTEPSPDPTGVLGCCSHGAYLTDADDQARVEAAAQRLTPEVWQHQATVQRRGGPMRSHPDGSVSTRRTQGACVFLNGADFAGGAGCALHLAAISAGEDPLEWKPEVCWQVPLRFDVHTDDNGRDTYFLRAWERADWGDGGDEFGWWCTEEPAAFSQHEPLYRTMQAEITALVGPEIYGRLAEYLDHRAATPVRLGVGQIVGIGR